MRMLHQEVDDPAPVRRPQQRHELGVAEPEGCAGPGGFELVGGGAHGEVHDEFGGVGDDVVLELEGGGWLVSKFFFWRAGVGFGIGLGGFR